MEFEHIPRILNIAVITLSDRASKSEYADTSGPQIQERCMEYYSKNHRKTNFEYQLLPDNAEMLKSMLRRFVELQFDIIFTTGGTGLGPRDFTPEVVKSMLSKEIPGIMEHIRTKYGQKIPHALLSWSVAGLIENTLVFTLPGSVKAVNEYLNEILPITEHALFTINGLSFH
jgi:molybdenum cofactor synthesis domain-containing protein